MGGRRGDDGTPESPDARELDADAAIEEAAEGLRRARPRVPPDAPTVPGIPLEALSADVDEDTRKLRTRDGDSEADPEADEDTLPPEPTSAPPAADPPRPHRRAPPDAQTVRARPPRRSTRRTDRTDDS